MCSITYRYILYYLEYEINVRYPTIKNISRELMVLLYFVGMNIYWLVLYKSGEVDRKLIEIRLNKEVIPRRIFLKVGQTKEQKGVRIAVVKRAHIATLI
jgi:hypothetical protein